MTQEKQTTILESIQSEVSKEASPLLEFLIKHSRFIVLGIVALIAAIIIVGVMNYNEESSRKKGEEALGKIIIMPDDAAKITALEQYVASASDSTKNSALFALMYSATVLGNDEVAGKAWHEIASLNKGSISTIAKIAEANSLAKAGKGAEAIAMLQPLQAAATKDTSSVINSIIVDIAEAINDWDKAIAASEVILQAESAPESKAFWEQRIAYLQSKKQ